MVNMAGLQFRLELYIVVTELHVSLTSGVWVALFRLKGKRALALVVKAGRS